MGDVSRSAFEWIARWRRDPFILLIVVLAGLGTAHILVRTATYGAAVGGDSTIFLSTAMNFLAGEGWRDFRGGPAIEWPPLFPLLLAAFGWVGIELLAASRWINAVAFGLTILVAGGWLRSNLRSRWLAVAATATIVASLPLSALASKVKTDSLFVLFTLFILMLLAAFINRKTAAPLWWAAGFTALAALLRYPGVVLIGTGVLLLLPFARLKQTVVFGACSSLPLLAALAYYWAVAGHLTQATGDRTDSSGQPLLAGLSQIGEVFGEWVVPLNAPDGVAYLLWLVVAAVGLAGTAVVLHTIRMRSNDGRHDREAGPLSYGLGPAVPFGVFALIYLVFMVVVVPFTVEQGIDSRYLLPVHVPLLLVAAFLLDRFLSIEAAGWMAAARYGLASLVLLGGLAHGGFSTYRGLRLTAQAWISGYEGRTYNTPYWQHSETLKYLRSHRIDGKIYTNRPFLAWFADRTSALGRYQHLPGEMGWTEIEAGTPIVWLDKSYKFYNINRFYLSHDTDLRVLPGVEPVAELADGVVFRRTAAEPFDAQRHRARKQRYVEQLIQQAQAGERVVRADWDVYRTGRKLAYFKKPCAPADVQAKFVLHVIPADPVDLPAHRQRYGFDNLGFHFDRRGMRVGDQCMVLAHLPAYPIGRIRVGQRISNENRTLWDAEFAGAGN